jgi:excinuclease ABC subunit A
LSDVGLSYLTLNRLSATLSGGESQRINLAGSLGSSLVGSLYILDEPSIGLHPRDTDLLIKVLLQLRDIGNTVVVVEHDEDIISAADQIIDIGPLAGTHGGNVVFQGNIKELRNKKGKNFPDSMTAKYLNGTLSVAVPARRRNWNHYIEIIGASENNLKNVDVKFPLNVMTVVTGVSGSGKSSLVKNVLYPAVAKNLEGYAAQSAKYARIEGDYRRIESIEFVDQNPIGKSSRSNPVTYLKAFDEIRKLYSEQNLSKINGFQPSHFSFNVEGGRCEECKGEGEITVEMQFMADVHLECEHCKGKRFKDEVLEVQYKGKSIFDILEMTVEEAIEFFDTEKETKKISEKIKTLQDVGLGYVKLGQSSNTLSGGESQRIKLAYFLSKENRAKNTLFIFDEPTTGLHFHDINRLLGAFNALLDRGHSIVVIEHNREVIKCADYIIDLGPEGGDEGGNIVFAGTPEELLRCKTSHTAKYLETIL